ncbi:hypothetical protein [Rubinisphaera margarita]|uniref:hypothetical protein n=1 Tax=Rubinisphaera margarita TaxID=2909586 RepID=UPI001EE8BFF1|nr:hypothetical protein [Rubinisphaera margarita]MCG6154489.1 hypothetical protein [Rubinisphaera margarita]
MLSFRFAVRLLLIALITGLTVPQFAAADVREDIAAVLKVDHQARNIDLARQGVENLQKSGIDALLPILNGLEDANPLAANYLRNAFETVASDAVANGQKLPVEDLLNFVRRTKNRDIARRLAFEWIRKVEPEQAEELIPNFLGDPSAELRREAVARLLKEAEQMEPNNPGRQSRYLQALSGASDDDQVKKIVAALKDLDVEVNVQEHYGFLNTWHLIGPFDNRDKKGFDVVYPPENEINLEAEYEGQLGPVRWQQLQTDDPYGLLNIATDFGPYKGAVVYAYSEFESEYDQPVELRLATPNAWKIWLNDELVFEREEYHRGTFFDQYRVPARLKPGKNKILIKVLQNEQDDSWAQVYQIQFRICQPNGMALQPAGKE